MLEIRNIEVKLGDFQLKDFSLTVEKGDYFSILGLSGAGKTVLLEVIAGLVKPTSGSIWLGGEDITFRNIQKRQVGLVYQDMALFPHLSVYENIAYALQSKKINKTDKARAIEKLAHKTQVTHLLHRYPGTLSGGEAQRVALARTLAATPSVLLLDEPLASLDIKLRHELRDLLRQLHEEGTTILHVTHDPIEAASLSRKTAVIDNGRLVQCGFTMEVLRNPATEFVARFSGVKNVFNCRFGESNDHEGLFEALTVNGTSVTLISQPHKSTGVILVPAEDIIVSEQHPETSATNCFQGIVTEIITTQHGIELKIQTRDEFSVLVSRRSVEKLGLEPGKKVWIAFKASAVKML